MGKKVLGIFACLGIILGGVYYLLHGSGVPSSIGMDSTNINGPDRLVGKIDIKDSPYFKAPDFYNMKSGGSLILLEKFKTHQQRSGYTCGPAAAAMVIEFLTGKQEDEFAMGKIMGTNNRTGTTIKGMAKYFESIGWNVKSSANTSSPSSYEEFLQWVDDNLNKGVPIIIENVDWGGHYRVIIGHDSMGTKHQGDDVLILADPFDTCDHVQDGYVVNNAEKLFYMWFDHQLFEKSQQKKPWVIAKPK